MIPASSEWTPSCARCGTPVPELPDPDAVITWSERHTCKSTERKAA
jgi:hypothetical protein